MHAGNSTLRFIKQDDPIHQNFHHEEIIIPTT